MYWGGDGGAGFSSFSIASGESVSLTGAGLGAGLDAAGILLTIDFGFAACHFSIPSKPPSSAAANPLPLTVWMWTTTGRWAPRAPPIARRNAPTSCPSITPTYARSSSSNRSPGAAYALIADLISGPSRSIVSPSPSGSRVRRSSTPSRAW